VGVVTTFYRPNHRRNGTSIAVVRLRVQALRKRAIDEQRYCQRSTDALQLAFVEDTLYGLEKLTSDLEEMEANYGNRSATDELGTEQLPQARTR